jgi:hypothetical protein
MFRRRRTHEDFSDELQSHIDLETDRLIADGLTPADARSAAIRSFGNVVAAKERYYEAGRWTWFEQLSQDLRYAWRGLRHSKAFFATTVLTLAVGLGLVTVAFTVFNAYVLRPFAVREPSNLYRIAWRSHDAGGQSFRWADYEELRERRDLFDSVIAEDTRFVSSDGRTSPRRSCPTTIWRRWGPASCSAAPSAPSTRTRPPPCSATRRGRGSSPPIPRRSAATSRSMGGAS